MRITSRRSISEERCWRPRALRPQTPGYAQALEWLSGFGEIDTVAVESTGSYAAALVRYLREHNIAVVEVNQPHAHTRRRVGKRDPIDAEMAARLMLAGKANVTPKQTDGIIEAIRMLRVARNSAVKARATATLQIRDLIITAPQPLRDSSPSARRSAARQRSAPASGSPPATSATPSKLRNSGLRG
jgi:transposase